MTKLSKHIERQKSLDKRGVRTLFTSESDQCGILPFRSGTFCALKRYASGHDQERQTLEAALKRLDDKEVNLWRAFTDHGMRPQVYERLAREYEDERSGISKRSAPLSKTRANLSIILMLLWP